MNVHISYKLPKTPDLEKEFNLHIEKLGRRLQIFRPELVHLHANIEMNRVREGVLVALNLRLPSGQLAAQNSAKETSPAIRAAFEGLTVQVVKHKDQLRNQHKWARRRRAGREQPEAQVPFESTLAAVQPPTVSEEDISAYVNANLARLSRYVERELRYRESLGSLQLEQLSAEEVVDEAVLNALGDGEKPERLALEPWLYRLAIRAIDELVWRSRDAVLAVPLDQNARVPELSRSGSDEHHLQYHQPDEAVVNRDLIADPRLLSPEASAFSDEILTLVEGALLGAKREEREAFLLYAVEGFTPEEIAAISDRSLEQVRASVKSAREFLRQALPASVQLKETLLPRSKTA